MTGAFLIIVMTAVILTWLLATHRSLAAMEENINSAMNQIGICFSSRFEAITALLPLRIIKLLRHLQASRMMYQRPAM